jgi:hypothetical protein
MVDNIIDCNYEDNLVSNLERISRDFFRFDQDLSEQVDIELLNQNTKTLNDELKYFRKLRTDLVNTNRITPSVRRQIKEKFVPRNLFENYDNANIQSLRELLAFTQANATFFRETLRNDEKVFEAVSSLDPIAFRTFESEYPSIAIRTRTGPISAAEVNALIRENGFDPKLFSNQVQKNRRSIFNLLEKFLSKLGIGIGIMGSFCSLVENVFALAKGQRDLTGNPAAFLGNFENVLGLINPSAGEVVGNIQQLISLMQTSQQKSVNIATNLQEAFGLLASAFGIVMQFADILQVAQGSTDQQSGLEIDWNLELIRDEIAAGNSLFLVILDKTNKPLGDINQDGVMDANDGTTLQTYINGSATAEVINYVEQVFLPYLNANAATFSQFVNFPTAQEPDSNIGNIIQELSAVASKIGAAPGSGDFGLSNILQVISIASSLISSVQALVSGSRPVNIQSLFQQLDQVIELGTSARQGISTDFGDLAQDYKDTVENALKEAEDNAVDNKAKTIEINEKNQESLETNFTEALETTAESSKDLGPKLIQTVNEIRNGIRQLAAVGVLENLNQQLESVIDQSASQLQSRINFFSPTSLNNGFHFNMDSSYGKLSGLVGEAKASASKETTNAMKRSVTGMIAQSAEKYRQKNKEEVEFVALRFCKLAGEIERMYKDITAPLEAMTSTFQGTDAALSAVGNDVTLRAVRAGAIRYDTETRLEAMRQSGTIGASLSSPFVSAGGFRSTIPDQGTFPYESFPPLPEDYEFPSYEDAITGRGGVRYAPGPSSRLSGRAGFLPKSAGGGVDNRSMRMLYQLARRWGSTIQINSAYRSPRANANAGGARNSFHMSGKAFDCGGITGRANQVRFMNLAYQVGFRGFGSYNNFVHIDTRGTQVSFGNFRYYNLSGPAGTKIG